MATTSPTSRTRRSALRHGAALLGGFAAGAVPRELGAQAASPSAGPGGIFDVRRFGATGRRADNATAACRAAVDACVAAGGGTVYVPPGDYTVGTIRLADHVTLHVDAGATLYLSQSRDDFQPGARAMIYAEDASTIALTGRGTLDGLAQYVYTDMRGVDPEIAEEIAIARAAGEDMRRYYRTGMQTYMCIFTDCRNVLLRDIAIVHSPLWTVRLNDCDRVHVTGVSIYSDLEKGVNADGIDIVSSRNVAISDSTIVTADDAIVLKTIARGGQPARPTENVTVTNCVLTSSSTPLMIGTETEAGIRHVSFTNCVIRDSNKGFGINVQDGATVSDVIVRGLTIDTRRRHWNWWGSAEFCKLVLKKRRGDSPLGVIRDVVVSDVIAHVRGTSTITGHADRPIENVRLSNVQLFMQPEDVKDQRATDALACDRVEGLELHDVAVRWTAGATEPKWRHAVALRRTSHVEIDGFSGRQGLTGSDTPAILLDDVVDGAVVNSRATDGCPALVHVQGGNTRAIVLSGNRAAPGGVVATYASDAVRRQVS
jgi:hypothetical protein